MKIQLKVIYDDEVKPTELLEVDNDSDKDLLLSKISELTEKVMSSDSNISGLFISRKQ